MRVREELERSEVELNRLLQDKMGRRVKVSCRVMVHTRDGQLLRVWLL